MFRQKLERAGSRNDSLLCVGLDPVPQVTKVADPERVLELNLLIVDATRDLVCAYKPNLAIYEGMGEKGWDVLRRTLDAIPEWIPKIGDAKRGDIDNCGEASVRALFEQWGFDAATVNPYMGHDAVNLFLQHSDKGVFVLCRTSNRSARDLQDLVVSSPDGEQRPLYLEVAALAQKWNEKKNVGLVVGATYPDEIRQVRRRCPDMLLLIPGVGAQHGDLEAAVGAARDSEGRGFIINVSRQIMRRALSAEYELLPKSQARQAVRQEAERLREAINLYRSREAAPTRPRAAAAV